MPIPVPSHPSEEPSAAEWKRRAQLAEATLRDARSALGVDSPVDLVASLRYLRDSEEKGWANVDELRKVLPCREDIERWLACLTLIRSNGVIHSDRLRHVIGGLERMSEAMKPKAADTP